MSIKKVLKRGDELLRSKSRPVEKFNQRLWHILDNMKDTMYEEDGVGLAAVQIGILRRIVVIDVGDGFLELVNPEIISAEGEQFEEEGCLSCPGDNAVTKRPMVVRVKAQDRNGNWCVYKGEGLKARCFCHEIDHLDGVLFLDRKASEDEIARAREKSNSDAETGDGALPDTKEEN